MTCGALLVVLQLIYALRSIRAEPLALHEPTRLVQSLALFILCYLLQLVAWLILMRSIGIRLELTFAFQGYFLSFLPRYLPGSVWGYFGRGEWLWTQRQIPYGSTNVGSALEALFFLATAGIWVLLDWSAADHWRLLLVGAVIFCWVFAWWVARRRIHRRTVAGTYDHWVWLLMAGTFYIVYWWVQGTALSALMSAFDMTTTNVGILSITSSAALAWSVGFLLILVPSGLGIREVSLAYLLATQVGLSGDDASLIAVLSRAAMILAEITLLALALFYNLRSANHTHIQSRTL